MTEETNKNGQDGEKGQEGTEGVSFASDSDTEIAKLQAQCDEYLNGWKRAKADYQNLKKETEEKQKVIFDFASANLLMEILPVYDNLKKALKSLPEQDNSWTEGIKQIKKQFESFLQEHGVEEIKTVSEKFNPEFHEAISKAKKEGIETDTIIAEVSSGYLMKGKVLMPAKVIVAE